MEDLGYETHNSILNLGSMWIFGIQYFLRVFIYIILKLVRYFPKNRYKFAFLEKWEQQMFFGELLSLCIDGYSEWVISGYLNLRQPLYAYNGDYVGNVSAFMCLLFSLGFVPISLLYFMLQSTDKYSEPGFITKWGFFLNDLKPNSKWSTGYFVIYVGRRLFFLVLVYYFNTFPSMQMLAIFLVNFCCHLYAASCPWAERYLNKQGMVEEFNIMIICSHMLCFTDWV